MTNSTDDATPTLTEIRERVDKVTPGKWEAFPDEYNRDDIRVCNIEDGKCIACLALMGDYDHERDVWSEESRTQWVADAEFVAHAPDDIRFLLAEIDHLRAAETAQAAALAKFSAQVNEKSQASLKAIIYKLDELGVDSDWIELAIQAGVNAGVAVHNRQVAEAEDANTQR